MADDRKKKKKGGRRDDDDTVDRSRPSSANRDEMVETLRMEFDEIHEHTQPIQPTLSAVTKRRKIPTPLLEASKRTMGAADESAELELFVFRAAPDDDLKIQIPSNLHERVKSGQTISVWLKLPGRTEE